MSYSQQVADLRFKPRHVNSVSLSLSHLRLGSSFALCNAVSAVPI